MYKFNDKSLARYRYKQKQNIGLHLYTPLSHQTLSVIAQVNLCEVFGSDVPVKLRTRVEILKVPIFVRVFFFLGIRNLVLQSGVCCIK